MKNKSLNNKGEFMTNTLPVYKGYTVDYRLREFRKMEYGKMPKTIKFNSATGFLMLMEYEATK